jgi:hypothetical protein
MNHRRPIRNRDHNLPLLLDCTFETLCTVQVWRKWRF